MPKLRRITSFPSPGTRIIDLTVEQLAAVLDAATDRFFKYIRPLDQPALPGAASAARLEALAGFMQPDQLRDFVRLYLDHAAQCAGRVTAFGVAGDYAAMGAEAHQLVGPAGHAGALEVCRLVQALAAAGRAGDTASCQRLAALLPPATEHAAGQLLAWLAEQHPDAAARSASATAAS